MNLYIIILRRTRSFFVFFFPLWQNQVCTHSKKKKDLVSEERPEQNLRFRPPKSEKKESKNKGEGKENRKKKRVTSIFTLFRSLSLCSRRAFKDEFLARKRHIFVAVTFTHTSHV
jgi:hypothetical protein